MHHDMLTHSVLLAERGHKSHTGFVCLCVCVCFKHTYTFQNAHTFCVCILVYVLKSCYNLRVNELVSDKTAG